MIHTHAHYSLLHHNTFGMNVETNRFIEFDTADDLKRVLQEMDDNEKHSLLTIGEGSNLLFAHDYPGTVLHSAIRGIEIIKGNANSVWVKVGSGEVWDHFVAYCVEQAWYGAENLSGIPGEVGASAVQNIGAYGVEVKDLIVEVEAVEIATGRGFRIANEECRYAYRQSIFKQEWKGRFVVTHVVYKLSRTEHFHIDYGNLRTELNGLPLTLNNVRQAVLHIRNSKLPDPKTLGNAGSFFMNPIIGREQFLHLQKEYPSIPHYEVDTERIKVPAGWLIEQCGWKGRSLGHAAVHDKQALVLVNLGGATGEEVMQLAHQVVHDVKQKFGIEIHPEVNYII